MLSGIPFWLDVLFIATTLVALFFFFEANTMAEIPMMVILGWLLIQFVLSYSLFYTNVQSMPPRFLLMVLPPLLFIIFLFSTKMGRHYIDSLTPKWLTWLHVVRLPVEICLYFLFIYKSIPEVMTFKGHNWDIITGITAPVIAFIGYKPGQIKFRNLLIGWNIMGIILLVMVVIHGVLSVPTPFQKFGFEQPNVAILYFPFSLLPGFIVPLVFFAHLVCIRKLVIFR